ncbi:Uma2 family endonuclease [Spirulina sp. CS-785/01]|uniref:Uma2 family endonuclease n=1 Tax=Spirulina sp. CS-785/01 TaxID=3021716 RepID=UPI00232E400A|nr:Uma2 family endonuclease [Spirulina sp. CS-785/01]MDB9312977.1 Uma2 family endonuclease [Spirulina sp. CS-785/01]
MVTTPQTNPKITLDQFLQLPETKPYREYLYGQIQAKPMPQGQHSVLQARLGAKINEQVLPSKLAYALPELRCTFGGLSIVPDLSIVTWPRIPRNEQGKIANRFATYPDWVIEILSPEQSANKVIKKIKFCLEQGTELGWLLDPDDESVMILTPNQFPDIQSNTEPLTVIEDLQNHLQLSAQEIFSWLTF